MDGIDQVEHDKRKAELVAHLTPDELADQLLRAQARLADLDKPEAEPQHEFPELPGNGESGEADGPPDFEDDAPPEDDEEEEDEPEEPANP